MGCAVYANGDEIACKKGGGKVIASFPDVCLTPPPPPAGPLPVPYPDTSFSKDMKEGSKTVMIEGDEVMLKDQSFYKSSPLGDEAATNGQGANVITHVITGKTYFVAWSMDVKFEDQNVDRHTDITTSNHASRPAGAVVPNLNAATLGLVTWENQTCPDPVLHDIANRKAAIEQRLKDNHKLKLPSPGKGKHPPARATECMRLRAKRDAQNDLLRLRVEKREKCFNDPAADECPGNQTLTDELKNERATHEGEILELAKGIHNTNADIRLKC